jgi:hypothetical protein
MLKVLLWWSLKIIANFHIIQHRDKVHFKSKYIYGALVMLALNPVDK